MPIRSFPPGAALGLATGLALLTLPMSTAQAAALPAFEAGICVTVNYPDAPSCTTNTDATPVEVSTGGLASSSASDMNHGTLRSSLEAVGGPDLASTYASLRYTFEISPTDPSTPIDIALPFRIQAYGTSQMTADGQKVGGAAEAIFFLEGPSGILSQNDAYAGVGSNPTTFNVDKWVDVLPGTYSVYLATSVQYDSDVYNAPAAGSAFVDPTFTIDPRYASRYEIVGLPGTDGPIPAVPEPASGAMTLGALVAIAAVRSRRGRR